MPADLHIHTTVSDGTDTPAQVVERALSLALQAIAITDHDTIDGVAAARQAAEGKSIDVLAGVEISCYYNNSEVHILGYFKEPNHPQLVSALQEMRDYRLIRAQKMVDKLNAMGCDIKWSRVQEIAGEGTVGRPHIADALVERNIVPNREAAFKEYIGRGCPAYVPRKKIAPTEAIKLISQSGGIPVLAHPGTVTSIDMLPWLINCGLKGIEVWHPHHSPLQCQYYLKQAEKWNLIPTGGSDYHGKKHDLCNRLGAVTAPMESFKRIRDLLK
ncbi:putative metal-dependent phosphoesterase TrpH [Desulfohalotomaculum tongense]|uniref:PHP domain-containing protein n=1 Tax=Desulforadius tongensis TaxID=1216062 RepID=UPI00195916CD|nr:PHP domain-containing protein [Desulforadius tongensis]MBM7854482.1 putative metal-dependent phosphoesterase TrpH [Desulforadius tongensis]